MRFLGKLKASRYLPTFIVPNEEKNKKYLGIIWLLENVFLWYSFQSDNTYCKTVFPSLKQNIVEICYPCSVILKI